MSERLSGRRALIPGAAARLVAAEGTDVGLFDIESARAPRTANSPHLVNSDCSATMLVSSWNNNNKVFKCACVTKVHVIDEKLCSVDEQTHR